MTQTVLILGASGKIGSHSSDAFRNAGWTVRCYKRGTDMTTAARGADVIVNGLNPPGYNNWTKNIPAITNAVITAAKASGATVILPGNIYNFGWRTGIIDENTPHTPNTRKGQIRVNLERAYKDSGVPTIILRAGNFIDPNGNGDLMSLLMMRNIANGKITAAGDPDCMQAYAYVPDWARTAVMLAERRNELTRFADIPFSGHSFTVNQLRNHVAKVSGRKITVNRFPWWIMTALAPFWELAREMREMRYLYDMSHQISGDRLAKFLPNFTATDTVEVMHAGLPHDMNPNQITRRGRDKTVSA